MARAQRRTGADDLIVGQRGVAAVDVADDVGVGRQHHVGVDQPGAEIDGPPVWMVLRMPCWRAHATICRASPAALTLPSPTSPNRHAGRGQLGEVALHHALLQHRRPRAP